MIKNMSKKKLLLGAVLGLAFMVSNVAMADAPSGTFRLHNLWESTCLGVAGGNPTLGTKMILWPCDGSANQNFTAVPTVYPPNAVNDGQPLYTLVNGVGANRVLGVVPNGGQNSTVVIWTADNSANQEWSMTPVYVDHQGHQCYAIRSNGANTMLTPVNENTTVGEEYVRYWYSNDGTYTVTYGDPANQQGTFGGATVGASTLIFGAAFLVNGQEYDYDDAQWYGFASGQLFSNFFWTYYGIRITYDPQTYSAQYWCAY